MTGGIKIFVCVFQALKRRCSASDFLYRSGLKFQGSDRLDSRVRGSFGLPGASQNRIHNHKKQKPENSYKTGINPLRALGTFLFCLICFGCGGLFDREGEGPSETPVRGVEEDFDIYETGGLSEVSETGMGWWDEEGLLTAEEEKPPLAKPFAAGGNFPFGAEGAGRKEGVILLTEDRELTEDTFIQGGEVILKGVTITTLQNRLHIKADKFVADNSVIQNFPMGETARRNRDGRGGGNILIEAKRAEGGLGLILNGEKGGSVPKKSRRGRRSLNGGPGDRGDDAVYESRCRPVSLSEHFDLLFLAEKPSGTIHSSPSGFFSREIFLCREVCAVPPTAGTDGEAGRSGLPGFDGKKGGRSGSFHLKAFHVSDFRLTGIYNVPGAGSDGGLGSSGGGGGKRGRNGKDEKDLCAPLHPPLPELKTGSKGERGPQGKRGIDGERGTVCVERVIPDYSAVNPKNPIKEAGEITCY